MDTLTNIILYTTLGSIVSLTGGLILLSKESLALKASHFLASFAAGALLGTAFLDLLPEAAEFAEGTETNIYLWTLLGIIVFFLLERFIHWFHHHPAHQHQETGKSVVSLVIIGDSIHNFIDGVVIAAAFMANAPLGIVTALAVAAHEIPQEIGDFGILLHKGFKRSKIIMVNILSALTSLAGAILTYLLGESVVDALPILLSITAGFFIYIATADLIPEIHNQEKKKIAFWETVLLLLAIIIIYFLIGALEAH